LVVLAAKASRLFKAALRKNQNKSPWNSLVPDFVTEFTAAAECPPLDAS
jgi:hypothetical protein